MPPFDLDKIQDEIGAWNDKNFPDGTPDDVLIGATEELGELAHAHLKGKQGIRGTTQQHYDAACDALGDIAIYLMAYCHKRGISFEGCIDAAWDQVKKRDWTKNKENGE